MRASRWWWRLAAVVVVWVGSLVAGSVLLLEPDPMRTFLVVALLVALSGLLADTVADPAPEWHRDHPDREDWRGHDQRTGFYVRMLESHLTARSGDPVVRDRLVGLAEQTQQARQIAEPDPGLARLARQPPRRLTREELDQWISRIEQL